MGKAKNPYAWDKGLQYEKVKCHLRPSLSQNPGKREIIRALYLTILAIQLRNGCRISEAVDAMEQFLKTQKQVVEVRVRKRKDNYMRKVKFPEWIPKKILKELSKYTVVSEKFKDEESKKKLVKAVKKWCLKNLGFNTHALRYAFVSYLAKKGVSPNLIAKITGHAKLDFILHYTEKETAEEILIREDLF